MSKAKRSLTWRTAMALHQALKTGRTYTPTDVREEIEKRGGSPRYISPAAKWLRNHGIAVATKKARHMSQWFEAVTPTQVEEYGERVIQEAYSEIISLGRSCHTLSGPGSRVVKRRFRRCAIELGEHLGLEVDEVMADLRPLHAVNGTQ